MRKTKSKQMKPKRWVRTVLPKHEIIPTWENDQTKSVIYFMDIGPTRGARGFEHIIQNKNELLAWTEDAKSDIPFFYLKFKKIHPSHKQKFEDEMEGLTLGLDGVARIAIRPKGTAVDCLIVAVRHDKSIYVQGDFPKGEMLNEIKFLCDNNNISLGITFGGRHGNWIGLPWKV
jgi:hypothetical protein